MGAAGEDESGGSLRVLDVYSDIHVPSPMTDVHSTCFAVKGVGTHEIRAVSYDRAGAQLFDSSWQRNDHDGHLESNEGQTLAEGVYLFRVWVRIGEIC